VIKPKKYVFLYDKYSVVEDRYYTLHLPVYAKNAEEAVTELRNLGYDRIYRRKKR
jgi:hypothetical protein